MRCARIVQCRHQLRKVLNRCQRSHMLRDCAAQRPTTTLWNGIKCWNCSHIVKHSSNLHRRSQLERTRDGSWLSRTNICFNIFFSSFQKQQTFIHRRVSVYCAQVGDIWKWCKRALMQFDLFYLCIHFWHNILQIPFNNNFSSNMCNAKTRLKICEYFDSVSAYQVSLCLIAGRCVTNAQPNSRKDNKNI